MLKHNRRVKEKTQMNSSCQVARGALYITLHMCPQAFAPLCKLNPENFGPHLIWKLLNICRWISALRTFQNSQVRDNSGEIGVLVT